METIKEDGFTYTVSELALYNVDKDSPGICVVCDSQADRRLPIHSQSIPLCNSCITVYSEIRIIQVLQGFFKNAERQVLHSHGKKKEAKRAAKEAGNLLGKSPTLAVRLIAKGFEFTVQVIDLDSVGE